MVSLSGLIDGSQFRRGQECRRFRIHRPAPGNVPRPRNVTAPHGSLVGIVGHVQTLACELLGAAYVHHLTPRLLVGPDLVSERPDGVVHAVPYHEGARGHGGDLLGEGPLLVQPAGPTPIHDFEVLQAEQLEHPEGIAGPPVVLVSVEDHGGVVMDPQLLDETLEVVSVQVVPGQGIVEIQDPVDLESARDVAHVVEDHVLVGFQEPDLGVVEVVLHPVRGDEHVRMGVAPVFDGDDWLVRHLDAPLGGSPVDARGRSADHPGARD